MRNKVLLILVLPLMVELMVACCDCLEPTYFNYSHCNLSLSNLDNSGSGPVVTQSNKISKDAFGIRVVIARNENICKIKNNKSFFLQSAYAISCDCPAEFQYTPLDSITAIKVITTNAFNSAHLENTDVSQYFYVLLGSEFLTIEEYLNSIEFSLYALEDQMLEFDVIMMTSPNIGTEHDFKITVELSDGRSFNAQTGPIEFY